MTADYSLHCLKFNNIQGFKTQNLCLFFQFSINLHLKCQPIIILRFPAQLFSHPPPSGIIAWHLGLNPLEKAADYLYNGLTKTCIQNHCFLIIFQHSGEMSLFFLFVSGLIFLEILSFYQFFLRFPQLLPPLCRT